MVVREGERVLPAHPLISFLSLVLLGRVNPSSIAVFISLSFTPSRGGGHGPRFAVGTTRATGHEPRATRTWPDTTSSTRRHATVTFSPSLLILILSLSVCFSYSSILSLSLAAAYTHDAYDRVRSRHGRWQRVRGT